MARLTWACFRDHRQVVSPFISHFFNKLCLVATKGRKVNNDVTILLIDLLLLNLVLSSLSLTLFVFFFLFFVFGL